MVLTEEEKQFIQKTADEAAKNWTTMIIVIVALSIAVGTVCGQLWHLLFG